MVRRSLVSVVSLALAAACAKQAPSTAEPAPAEAEPGAAAQTEAGGAEAEAGSESVVKNVDAQPGDTTTCPFSGRTFVVKADHPRVEYQGKQYWICSEKAAESVRADPDEYLADFDG